MIQSIDQMLFKSEFASRSDFFRHLVRMWQAENEGKEVTKIQKAKDLEKPEDEFANVDCEFGIPPAVVQRLQEIAKFKNE